jgi:hypothetical protein
VAKRAEASFGPGAIVEHATGILRHLHHQPTGTIKAPNLQGIARQFGIPLKFLMRARASTSGVVHVKMAGTIMVVLQRKRLRRGKASAGLRRRQITPTLRARLLVADGFRCSHCRRRFSSGLTIDHIVPLSLLGADEPGNWVALCKRDNRDKWQHFRPGFLRLYRGKLIRTPIGVRFKAGHLWPRVNGQVRDETRTHVSREREAVPPRILRVEHELVMRRDERRTRDLGDDGRIGSHRRSS